MTVKCSQGHENPDGSFFCDECAEPLQAPQPVAGAASAVAPAAAPPQAEKMVQCVSCGSENPTNEAYCSNCGAPLPSGTAQPGASGATGGAQQAASTPAATSTPVATPPPVAAQPATVHLVLTKDGHIFDVSGKNPIIIGRQDDQSNIFPDIDLTDHGGEEGGVSRLHAQITESGGQYMIEDENSTNFTFINKQKITPKQPTPLHNGDEIKLGRVVLRFEKS